MASRRTAPASYRAAQREARAVERDLLRRVGKEIDRALARTSASLQALLRRLPDGSPEQRRVALQHSIDVFAFQRRRLVQQLEIAALAGRSTSFADVLAAWQDAAKRAASAVGVSNATLGAVLLPRTSLLAVYENVGGARYFRTLLARAADDGFQAVNDILRAGILEGKSFEKLARELRPFVQGADAEAAGAAFSTIQFNATRIAYSEIHNARAEAEVQHFALDPLIEAVAWRLSPDRGTLRGPDVCDALAENDFYGMGPGVYPVDAVPLPPHPFDRCERVPITRPLSRADEPKPRPPLVWDGGVELSRGGTLSDAAIRAIQRNTRQVLTASTAHAAGARVRDLLA